MTERARRGRDRAVAAIFLLAGAVNFYPVIGVLGADRLQGLYGMTSQDPGLELLLRHRAVLFGLLVALMMSAGFRPSLRPLAFAAGLVSMLAFMVLAWPLDTHRPEVARVFWADTVATAFLLVALALHVWPAPRAARVIGVAIALFLLGGAMAQAQEHAGVSFQARLVRAAIDQTGQRVTYDGSYRRIPYPGGDVPAHIGVCTDVLIRAYRAAGIDLQQKVHEDMRAAFGAYPKVWGLKAPDSNIDHRRVPNLQTFFRRRGAGLRVSDDQAPTARGDVVSWMLPGNLPHIGLVGDRRSEDGRRPLIVHNIGRGPEVEDMLFTYPVTGHYRYHGE